MRGAFAVANVGTVAKNEQRLYSVLMPRERIKTEGMTSLLHLLEKRRWSQAKLAQMLGVTQATVCQWCKGLTRPSLYRRWQLRVIGRIQEASWLTKTERKWWRLPVTP